MRIALLTDFGTRDPYVAAMKGVLAARTSADIVDLSHDIAPFDVLEAAWFLRTAVPWWTLPAIFVCVVDPGVGSDRKIIAARVGNRILLAPDNGLLTFIEVDEVRSVENERLFLPNGSTTFHGRDRFAPVAAALAEGLPLTEVGPALDSIQRLPYELPRYEDDEVRGTVVAVDRFGNLITDIERSGIRFERFELSARGVTIDRLEQQYAGAGPGAFLIVGSSGCIEVSVANGSAAERLGWKRMQRVVVTPL